MFNIKEISIIFLSSLLVAFAYFLKSWENLAYVLAFMHILIIFLVYLTTQKIAAYYFDAHAETKIWTEKRYWIAEKSYFKFAVPWGFLLSFVFSILSSGIFKWLALTETELKVKKSRVARKHYFYSYTNLTEWNISLICGSAIISLFFLSLIGYFFSGYYPSLVNLSKLCGYFALFNLIPLGNLDGMKIFAGSFKFWFGLVILTVLGLIISVTL
jgi:hypothetical protein